MPNDLAPLERLQRVLQRRSVDRPPVLSLGGMMNAALVEIMQRSQNPLPDAYDNPETIARLASDVAAHTGFECVAVPFCMTIEAELLGSDIDPGTLQCEAKIRNEASPSVHELRLPILSQIPSGSRAHRVIEAITLAKRAHPELPIIGGLTGPVSTAASVVSPLAFLKDLRRAPEACHSVLAKVTDLLEVLGSAMIEAGADAIGISDPTATGEILGPISFSNFAKRWLDDLVGRLQRRGVPVLVHICGSLSAVEREVVSLRADALSTDSNVSLIQLKKKREDLITMGNISTHLLQFGNPDQVAHTTQHMVDNGINIIAPACGLSTSTPLNNVRAMTDTVRKGSH